MQTSTNKCSQNYNFVKNVQGLLCFPSAGKKRWGRGQQKNPNNQDSSLPCTFTLLHIETQTRMQLATDSFEFWELFFSSCLIFTSEASWKTSSLQRNVPFRYHYRTEYKLLKPSK